MALISGQADGWIPAVRQTTLGIKPAISSCHRLNKPLCNTCLFFSPKPALAYITTCPIFFYQGYTKLQLPGMFRREAMRVLNPVQRWPHQQRTLRSHEHLFDNSTIYYILFIVIQAGFWIEAYFY